MAEHLGDLQRTHTCGELRPDDVGKSVVVLGWVHRIRDLGGVAFLDIRDRAGISQVVVRENDALMTIAKRLRSEFVVGVSGMVQRRSPDTENAKLATGEVEILARDIRLLSEAKTPTTNSDRSRLAMVMSASFSRTTTCEIPARSRMSRNVTPPRSRMRCTQPSTTTVAPTSSERSAPHV